MSVVSKNPFDLLGDDGDESPAPAPKAKATPAAGAAGAKKADAPAPKRDVPGAAGANAAARGGRYPNRGGPRNVYRGDNKSPVQENTPEGTETGQFDGERAPPSRKGNHNHIRDAHTKGPRGSRPAKNYTSGGHTSRGGGAGGRTPAQGGERRQFERRSGGLPDSQKKVDQGWGANEGEAELNAEVEGQTDAVAEEKDAAADGGWDAPETPAAGAEATADAAAPAEEQEPEEVQRSLDDYLAERAAGALGDLGKKERRTVNAETLEGSQFTREGIDEFFQGKAKTSTKTARVKKEKVYIEVDGQFAQPAGGARRDGDRPPRTGGDRGERSERGRGGPRGGRGGPRGAPRGAGAGAGGATRGPRGGQSAPIDANDTSAFPALGA